MKVRVTKEGFMFGVMQKVGAVITLKEDRHFSENWMEKIEEPEKPKTPKKSTKSAKNAEEKD